MLETIHIAYTAATRGDFLTHMLATAYYNRELKHHIRECGRFKIQNNKIAWVHKDLGNEFRGKLHTLSEQEVTVYITNYNETSRVFGNSHYVSVLEEECFIRQQMIVNKPILITFEVDDINSIMQQHIEKNAPYNTHRQLLEHEKVLYSHKTSIDEFIDAHGALGIPYKLITKDFEQVCKLVSDRKDIELVPNIFNDRLLARYLSLNNHP